MSDDSCHNLLLKSGFFTSYTLYAARYIMVFDQAYGCKHKQPVVLWTARITENLLNRWLQYAIPWLLSRLYSNNAKKAAAVHRTLNLKRL